METTGVLGAYHNMMGIWSESEARTRCIGHGKNLGLYPMAKINKLAVSSRISVSFVKYKVLYVLHLSVFG